MTPTRRYPAVALPGSGKRGGSGPGVLADKAYEQNRVFMHWMTTGRPFVALKYAMTLDREDCHGVR